MSQIKRKKKKPTKFLIFHICCLINKSSQYFRNCLAKQFIFWAIARIKTKTKRQN